MMRIAKAAWKDLIQTVRLAFARSLSDSATTMVAVFAIVAVPPLCGQVPHFEAGVANVKVDLVVTQDGRVITGLQQTDFVVFDEGESRRVVRFLNGRSSLDLVLLLDVSGSMVRDIREMARDAAAALEHIGNQDRVAVVAFSVETFLIQRFTSDRLAIARAIKRVAARGSVDFLGTEISASIADCITLLRFPFRREESSDGVERSRAILVVTDNMPDGRLTPDEIIIRKLPAADTVLHGIVIHRSHFGDRKDFQPKTHPGAAPGYTIQNVFHIAPATGGEAILSTTTAQVRNALAEMLMRLRNRYAIWFHAPEAPSGMFRRISVQLSEAAQKMYPGAKIMAREGYYTR